MKWINKIAFYQNIRNEEPNKELAQEFIDTENKDGIKEISEYLYDKNKSVASDCMAVIYTIGYSKPELIQDYIDDFLELLKSKNNRMVWGSMIAISTIAPLKADYIFNEIDLLLNTIKKRTLITEVWGIKTLVNLSLNNEKYKTQIMPVLFDYLEKCRPIDFATRVETILPIIQSSAENEILERIIDFKKEDLSNAQSKKLATILKRNKNL